MNTLDILFLVLTGASVLYSLIRGFVREIFALLSLILGFFGASYGYLSAANWLRRWMENETLTHILGFILLFLLVALSVILLGKVFSRLVKKMDLSWADRLGGAAFGFVKAIFLIAIILLVLTAFLPPKSKILSESKVSPNALAIARGLSFLVPEKLRALYVQKERELKKYWSAKERPEEKGRALGEKRR